MSNPSIEAWAHAFMQKIVATLRADMENPENMLGIDANEITSHPMTVTFEEAIKSIWNGDPDEPTFCAHDACICDEMNHLDRGTI
jgi:hypothetical protein